MPIILTLIGIMEFSLLLWKSSALDNGVLELHRSVRAGEATETNYRAVVCDRAGSIVDCDPKTLVIDVEPLKPTTSDKIENRFNAPSSGTFLLQVNYKHSFIVPMFDAVIPGRILENHIIMYGEIE